MNGKIELISQIAPKNNGNFAIADVNELRGGYIQVETVDEMQLYVTKYIDRLREGMLCYVKESPYRDHIYQLLNGEWVIWAGQGSHTLATGQRVSVSTYQTLSALEADPGVQGIGELAFCLETDDLRYYDGTSWKTFNRIYVQDTPPSDFGGIWIDTSDEHRFDKSPDIVQTLLKSIAILQRRLQKVEYAFNCQMDFGGPDNNNYHAFNDTEGIEPDILIKDELIEDFGGSSEEQDNNGQQGNQGVVIADSPEPVEYKDWVPNGRHLQIKGGEWADIQKYQDEFAPRELIWCETNQSLYIKDSKTLKLIKIGSVGGNSDTPDIPIDDIMEGIIQSGQSIASIEFVDISNSNKKYILRVRDGELELMDKNLTIKEVRGSSQNPGEIKEKIQYYTTLYTPEASANVNSPLLYVNMLYCGGDDNETVYNPVDYNFIELANLNNVDLNLKGLFLHYVDDNTTSSNRNWVTLPLEGKIKAGNTFLIKGAPCGDTTIAKIKVGKPDMVWTKELTLNNLALETYKEDGITVDHSIWDNGVIRFSRSCSFYISGAETSDFFKNEPLQISQPWLENEVVKWYIDCVGIGKDKEGKAMPSESAPFATNNANTLLMRYYTMDGVSQAVKAIDARKNSTEWCYVDLLNTHQDIDLSVYTPRNSTEGKNVFFNKNLLKEGVNFVTCTFGYNAHTTRCFTWVSKGYHDEYLMFQQEGDDSWITIESFKAGDGRGGNGKNWDNDIYNRIRSITTDGTVFTVHKVIIDLEEPTAENPRVTYNYKVGRPGFMSDVKQFTLRNRQDAIDNGFTYVQVTDQQGFNQEEYETWRMAAEWITEKYPQVDFSINTGDATQNGNRINEWIDYFNAGKSMFDRMEQMYTVGNNDLCPVIPFKLGDGSDTAKNNPINVQYFFTFEHPFGIPVSTSGIYIPCVYSFVYGNTYFLSVNSEITNTALTDLLKQEGEVNIYNDTIKDWCNNDLSHLDDKVIWKVAYCHESPYTIITNATINKYVSTDTDGNIVLGTGKREGSHLNTTSQYKFSTWLEEAGFKLCMCGHKHTYSCSRLIRENSSNSMAPYVYDPVPVTQEVVEGETVLRGPSWYLDKDDRQRSLVTVTTDRDYNYVQYAMCQATGYKLTSNKELPAAGIPWLKEYYPCTNPGASNPTASNFKDTVNKSQQFPNFILWNVGEGKETELNGSELEESRNRILGKSRKLGWKGVSNAECNWSYKYNVPKKVSELVEGGGNGTTNGGNNNIIVEQDLYSGIHKS